MKYDDSNRFVPAESILICYLVEKQMDNYITTLNNLLDDSIYKIMLQLYHKIIQELPFLHEYTKAVKSYPHLIDLLIGELSIDSVEIDLNERFFIEDFYYEISHDTKAMKRLKEVHLEY
jgi:hypothetical protein